MTAATNGTDERGAGQPPSERITVALIPKAAADLQRLLDATSYSKTEVVNRAIQIYAFLEGQMSAGRDLLVRDTKTGESQIVHIL